MAPSLPLLGKAYLTRASEVLPKARPQQIAEIESGQIPFTLAAPQRIDLRHAIEFRLKEALSVLQSALEDDEVSIQERAQSVWGELAIWPCRRSTSVDYS